MAEPKKNLVLSRKVGKTLYMRHRPTGLEISLTVLRIAGGQVKLAIAAPASVEIERDDLKTGPKSGRS